jgi:hypothetical protein
MLRVIILSVFILNVSMLLFSTHRGNCFKDKIAFFFISEISAESWHEILQSTKGII